MQRTIRALLAPLAAGAVTLRRLLRQRDGVVAILFALAMIPVIVAAGIAIDTARAYMVKTRLGAALDAAALAVGSQTNETSAQLTTDLKNYFYDNYCKSVPAGASVTQCLSTIAAETNITVQTVQPDANISGPTVTYQAQATVPTTFMRLVGIYNVTVSVTAQTTKFPGMEIAVVLDNTGSMLCGPNDGAPYYNDGLCANGVDPSDVNCTNSNNQSRICTLINAAKQFVTTLQNAITGPQSIYMAIVPYVTTVNVGNTFCTPPASCNNYIAINSSSDFTDERGNIIYDPSTLLYTPLTPISLTGATITNGSNVITNILSGTSNLSVCMPIKGNGIPFGTWITSIDSSTQIHINNNATSSGLSLSATGSTASLTNGSNIVTFSSALSPAPTVGMVVIGGCIPTNTTISSVDSPTQIHISNPATGTTTQKVPLSFYKPATFNTTTTSWGGCVVEPTSSDENSGVSGVINSGVTDPDTSEPSGGWPQWYPLYWISSSSTWYPFYSPPATSNPWTQPYAQDTSDEIQGTVVATFDQFYGPNEGCPVPLLPLTDLTTASGQTTIMNKIGSMWPRDAGGTQVHIGLIWGWRVLSPNGPFAPNNGHPLDYATANAQGWKKIIVLMTDGQEEWPFSTEDTGLGVLSDGKIGTTSNTGTAVSNLDTRLQTACTNLKASNYNGTPNYMIYTIGLGSDGASNHTLQTCAGNGGFFSAATPSNLQQVFQSIANSIIHLRLTE